MRIQRLLDDNEAWKAQATTQIHQLQAAVAALLQRTQLPDLPNFHEFHPNTTSPTDSAIGNVSTTESVIAPYDMRESSPDRQADDPGLVQAPMSNLYELTKATHPLGPPSVPRHIRLASEQDLIASGVLSISCAEQLLSRFLTNQNPLLWGGIIFPYQSLDALRCTSVLLSTAIFTIASLHSPGGGGGDVLQKCYDTYISLGVERFLECTSSVPGDVRVCAQVALFKILSEAHMDTLLHITGEEDMRRALNGVPLFTHTMIAFCATFLLKVAAIWARGGDHLSQSLGLGFNLAEIVSLARRTADLLARVAEEEVSEKHLMRLIVAGIREMLQRLALAVGDDAMEARPAGKEAGREQKADGTGAAVDFATVQMGDGIDGMIYNMDLHSLAGLLEYGSDQFLDTFVSSNELDAWDAPS
ncbi:unnamed protein product [Clonostachys rosea f. rosea IK726]|uniref:Uncharacterized protein n=1 Tax=Clonostachys rosea f. rosea IK726 TaxID=1349383 RepID=A0ACA9TPR7_BIOOC|nr:unnamed protein product [Clonostachys rosea f. rosea IK726]